MKPISMNSSKLNEYTIFIDVKDIDEGQKEIERIQKEIAKYSTTDISAANNQGLDQKLENRVKVLQDHTDRCNYQCSC